MALVTNVDQVGKIVAFDLQSIQEEAATRPHFDHSMLNPLKCSSARWLVSIHLAPFYQRSGYHPPLTEQPAEVLHACAVI